MAPLPRRRAASLGLWAALTLAASALLSGCASSSQIYIRSTAQTNDGNTLYMLIRNADRATAAENYQDVSTKVFADPPDPSVLSTQAIIPGNTATVKLDEADKKDIIIYFFFTDPGSNWRLPLRRPLPAEVFIDLGVKQIDRVQVRRR